MEAAAAAAAAATRRFRLSSLRSMRNVMCLPKMLCGKFMYCSEAADTMEAAVEAVEATVAP